MLKPTIYDNVNWAAVSVTGYRVTHGLCIAREYKTALFDAVSFTNADILQARRAAFTKAYQLLSEYKGGKPGKHISLLAPNEQGYSVNVEIVYSDGAQIPLTRLLYDLQPSLLLAANFEGRAYVEGALCDNSELIFSPDGSVMLRDAREDLQIGFEIFKL